MGQVLAKFEEPAKVGGPGDLGASCELFDTMLAHLNCPAGDWERYNIIYNLQ